MKRYSPKEIEPKWQKMWDETNIYRADLGSDKPKYIAMSMFNYPSGGGIHIGHAMNYTISDVMARFKRQQGFESYHPVGWDAFGLPAENYAIKAGVSPQASMATIIPNYHKQYKAMGWSNDWSREIATHEPEYYKWTQWIFSEMYRNGLAYQDVRFQWWCEKCQTVLANEQVIDGKCWRHDGKDDLPVAKKEVKQWFFKITDYANELLSAIDDLDWTPSVKLAQKNWIGRSEGINIDYAVDGTDHKITCFTTTPVNYGMTFIVLAPEHDLVEALTTTENKDVVKSYISSCSSKSDLERLQEGKDKTGVFTGSYVVNHLNGEKAPVWVADFVLASVGTGAVQGCPAHDERDFEFAKKFGLPIIRVVAGPNGEHQKYIDPQVEGVDQVKLNHGIDRKMVNSYQFDGMIFDEAMQTTMDYFVSKGWGSRVVNYKMRDWSVSRQRYWGAPIPIVNCGSCGQVLVEDKDLPVVLPELKDFQPSGDGRSALARASEWLKVECPKCGGPAERETDTLDTYICSSWYMYRYFDPRNSEAIFDSNIVNKWAPINFYNGGDHATAHLLYARFVARFFNKIGLVDEPEPFKQMFFNGKVSANDGRAFSKSKGIGEDPLEIINSGYGADALRTYLMFAAPLELGARWDPQGVPGAYRFLNRLWNLTQEYLNASDESSESATEAAINKVAHQTIKKVTADIEDIKFNTAVAALMEAVNKLYLIHGKSPIVHNETWKFAISSVVALVGPFAPHLSEELWQQLRGDSQTLSSELSPEGSVNIGSWPTYDEKFLNEETINIVVQINGKLRSQLSVSTDLGKEETAAAAMLDPKVRGYLEGKDIKRTVVVPGKLVNFVV